jgi:hypothetical protein
VRPDAQGIADRFHTAARARACVQHRDRGASARQFARSHETGEPRAGHEHALPANSRVIPHITSRSNGDATYNRGTVRTTIILLVTLAASIAGCVSDQDGEPTMSVTQLNKQDTKPGTGKEAVAGNSVTVQYTGWLYDEGAKDHKGTKFDSSRDRNEPFTFKLGAGQVIKGWDEGVAGMKVGGQRVLTIPPDMGYGPRGAGGVIPPNAVLLFDVELLDVR